MIFSPKFLILPRILGKNPYSSPLMLLSETHVTEKSANKMKPPLRDSESGQKCDEELLRGGLSVSLLVSISVTDRNLNTELKQQDR